MLTLLRHSSCSTKARPIVPFWFNSQIDESETVFFRHAKVSNIIKWEVPVCLLTNTSLTAMPNFSQKPGNWERKRYPTRGGLEMAGSSSSRRKAQLTSQKKSPP